MRINRRQAGAGLGFGLAAHGAQAAPVDRPRKQVLAFYYGWYGTPARSGDWLHWQGTTGAGPRQSPTVEAPVLGRYDSHDPAVLARHATWCRAAGLTGVISSWWGVGSFEDRSLALLLEAMHREGLTVTCYLEKQSGGEAGAEAELRHILQRYGRHPAWLKVGGRPVVFLYLQALRDLDAAAWRRAARAAADGSPEPLLVGDISPRETAEFAARAPHMDGVHIYVLAPYVKGMTPEAMTEWGRRTYPGWKRMIGERIFCATVIPGFDDTKVPGRPSPRPTVARHGGRTFDALWQAAIEAQPDWVLITSWNEWHEGSEIEPSQEYGAAYLEQCARHARRFLRGA